MRRKKRWEQQPSRKAKSVGPKAGFVRRLLLLRVRIRVGEHRPKAGLARRLLRALLALLLTLLMIIWFVKTEFYDWEDYGQDVMAWYLNVPPADSWVAIVMIDDVNYKDLFKATSPLDHKKLQEVIGAIAKGKPRVIGVDIATEDDQFEKIQIDKTWPPIVWARAVFDFAPSNQPDTRPKPNPRDVAIKLRPEDDTGLPTLIDDKNGVTRLYQRMVETDDSELLKSFPWAVFNKFLPLMEKEASTDARLIKFARDKDGSHRKRQQFSASHALSKDDPWDGALRDKIVLLGGNYLGDQHNTPLGPMSGVHVLATVIETELGSVSIGGGIKQPSELTLVPLWIVQAVVLVLVFQFFPLDKAPLQNLALSLALVAVTAVVCSLIASWFHTELYERPFIYLRYFVPVALFVLALQLIDYFNDWRKKNLATLIRGDNGET